jgi:SanA protein
VKPSSRPLRRIFRWALALIILLFISIFGVDAWVKQSTAKQLYASVADIPHNRTGLLLGTSKFVTGGRLNYYYKYRIEAAIALFKAGKIDYILVSGDNGEEHYNEPETMQSDLIAAGVPADRIFLDYAGFRTLDSILRCRAIFSQDSVTIISQAFHNERAVAIANWKGLHTVAFNARDVHGVWGTKMWLREKAARSKMLLDLLFDKGPKFYGPKVEVGG